MIEPLRIGHAVLGVRNLERSTKFYTEILGAKVHKTYPQVKMVFLACGDHDHHELAIAEVGENAPGPLDRGVGLFHLAFRLRDWAHLQAAYRELKEKGVTITGAVDHNITRSVYFLDPDGNQLEVYCDNPRWREVIGTNRSEVLNLEGPEPEAVRTTGPKAEPAQSSATAATK